MTDIVITKKKFFRFFLLYAMIYGGNSIILSFMPVFLRSLDLSNYQIGLILSVSAVVAVFAQPLLGVAADRSVTKNRILMIVFAANAFVCILLFFLGSNFYSIIIIYSALMFFYTSVFSLSDSITLESLQNSGFRFGIIRMGGTIGYIIIVFFTGMVARFDARYIFPYYSILAVLSILVMYGLPKIKGHQNNKGPMKRISFWELLKERRLVIILLYSTVILVTFGFYYAFFPIYFMDMGAGESLVSASFIIAAVSEIPFLFFAHRFLEKLGYKRMLLLAGTVTAIRWLLLSLTDSFSGVIASQMLHAFGYASIMVTVAVFINENIRDELKASGQAASTLTGLWFSRIVGSFLGGLAAQRIEMSQLFLYTSIICICAVFLFYLTGKKILAGE